MTRTACFSPFPPMSLSSSVARTWLNVSSSRQKHNFQLPLLSSASVSGQTSPPPQAKWRLSHSGSNSPAVPLRQFIALSAAAALAFYFRRQGVKQYRLRNFMASASSEEVKPKAKRIDSHLHVWASPDEGVNGMILFECPVVSHTVKEALGSPGGESHVLYWTKSDDQVKLFPYALGQQPTLPGSAAFLEESMSEAGVDGALIIQPIDHKFDHSYVSSVLQKYPEKFVGCCLADPTDGGGGVRELERLITKEGYRAVRFNPYLWPSGQQMTNEVGKAMFSKAGELGAIVGFMCFKGLLLHIDDIEELCLEFPSTAVMIDHFGFCKPAKSDEEAKAWERLLGLARFPQVYVKVSAFFRISREPFPYKDTWPLVQELLTVFGTKRLLWGSDFPFVAAECGYRSANQDLPQLIAETLSVSESEVEFLLGRTACQLFEGAWQESLLVS